MIDITFCTYVLFSCTYVLFQDWLAFTQGGVQLTFEGKLQFKNVGAPLEIDNFAFCKVIPCFSSEIYSAERRAEISNTLSLSI